MVKSMKIAGMIVVGYLAVASLSIAIYLDHVQSTQVPYHLEFTTTIDPPPTRTTTTHIAPQQKAENSGSVLRPPARTNFLFVGLDNNSLADAIMVGCFHRDSGDIHLMSIPRDMYTHIPMHRMDEMYTHGLNPPQTLKINAVRAFGGRVHGMRYLIEQLGDMLGVEFHHYIEVDLAAFARIVDAIGGVTMNIPRSFNYHDPCQGLVINIPKGLQHLDGHMAEGVVRFRSFPTGDLMRNQMQMEFMSELLKQSLTRDAIMNDPLALVGIVLNEVRTNVSIMEIAKYLPYIRRTSQENIQTFTLPGEPAYKNGVSWFMPDVNKLSVTVGEVFYSSFGNGAE